MRFLPRELTRASSTTRPHGVVFFSKEIPRRLARGEDEELIYREADSLDERDRHARGVG